MNIKSITVSVLIFSGLLLNAQQVTQKTKNSRLDKEAKSVLDGFISSQFEKRPTGTAILVARKGKVVYENYTGHSDIETGHLIKNWTKFNIGSITKQFTATAILLLQEQGKLKVSDYIGKHFKALNNEKYPIKIEHLLTHTSGIPSISLTKNIDQRTPSGISVQKVMALLNDSEVLFKAGEEYQYSNNGYILLGLLIEQISGNSYKDFISKHIFKPLKMNNSIVADRNQFIKKKALGYESNENNELVSVGNKIATFSAGNIVSTPRDLNKWTKGLFSHRIISEVSLSAMLKDYQLNNGEHIHQGYGWELSNIQNSPSYEHSGSTPGFKANSIYLPKEELYIILIQNSELGSTLYPSIQIASIVIENPYPSTNESISLQSIDVDKFIGTYSLENRDERHIGYNEEIGLYYKATGGKERKLFALNEHTLLFTQGYVSLNFEGNSDIGFSNFTYKNRHIKSVGTKISSELPEQNQAIKVDDLILQTYVGTYVSEQFTMLISFEDDKLFAQPQGSNKLELIPKGERNFFIDEIGAEIEFVNNDELVYIYITLEGNVMKGIKQ